MNNVDLWGKSFWAHINFSLWKRWLSSLSFLALPFFSLSFSSPVNIIILLNNLVKLYHFCVKMITGRLIISQSPNTRVLDSKITQNYGSEILNLDLLDNSLKIYDYNKLFLDIITQHSLYSGTYWPVACYVNICVIFFH